MGKKKRKSRQAPVVAEEAIKKEDTALLEKPRAKWRLHLIISLALFVIIIIAYHNAFGADFHLDDDHVIKNNPAIFFLKNVPEYFTKNTTVKAGGEFYRPVLFVTYAVDYALGSAGPGGRPDPYVFHVSNVIYHALAVLALYALVLAMLSTPRFAKTAAAGMPVLAAFCSALLFGLHPVQTQSVSYVSSRSEILTTLFLLLSVTAYLRGRLTEKPRLVITWMAASILFFFLAGLSKEYGLFLPFILFGLEVFLFPGFEDARFEVRAKRMVPFFAALAVLAALHGVFRESARIMEIPWSRWDYFAIQGRVLFHYFRIVLLPVRLLFDFNNDVSIVEASAWVKFFGWFLVACLIGMIVWAWRRFPAYALAALWFFVFLLPVSSFFPIFDVIFEHRLYAPLAFWGFLIAAAAAAAFRTRPDVGRIVLVGLTIVVGVFYGVATFQRNKVYETRGALWKDVIEKLPNSNRGHLNYANWHYDQASGHYRGAVDARNKKDVKEYKHRMEQYSHHMDVSIKHMREVVRLLPSGPKSEIGWNNLGKIILIRARRKFESAQGKDHPGREKYLAEIRKEVKESLVCIDRALAEYPLYSVAHVNRGLILIQLGDFEFESGNASSPDFPGYGFYLDSFIEFNCSIRIENMPKNVQNFRNLIDAHRQLMDASFNLVNRYARSGLKREAQGLAGKARDWMRAFLKDASNFKPESDWEVLRAHSRIAILSWAYLRDAGTARSNFKKLFSFGLPKQAPPWWMDARVHFGEMLLRTGEAASGRKVLEEVRRIAPGSRWAKRAGELLK
ncbi:MAG: hypothetical protein E3J72_21310 [Planctomycetota bacterium]|nr:MAG: hypothetical protein E3J72_21310 [Planctomycetota bacterium]